MERSEADAILTACLMAAFADGTQAESERARIKEVMGNLELEGSPDLMQKVVLKQVTTDDIAGALVTPQTRALAYEMALYICDADGEANATERTFLDTLRMSLRLDAGSAEGAQKAALAVLKTPVATEPLPLAVEPTDLEADQMILKYAILNGALELLPQSIATMAIIPLQMRMVYRLGQRHGITLDKGHVTEFLATVGIGLTSQMVEGMARRVLGTFARRMGGGLLGLAVNAFTGAALTFGTTYALGHVAKTYYAGGRRLDMAQLKQLFQKMLGEGKSLFTQHQGEVQSRARTLNVTDVLPLLKE